MWFDMEPRECPDHELVNRSVLSPRRGCTCSALLAAAFGVAAAVSAERAFTAARATAPADRWQGEDSWYLELDQTAEIAERTEREMWGERASMLQAVATSLGAGATVEAAATRAVAPATSNATTSIRDLQIDREHREVRVDGKAVHLETREFDLLEVLARKPGRGWLEKLSLLRLGQTRSRMTSMSAPLTFT